MKDQDARKSGTKTVTIPPQEPPASRRVASVDTRLGTLESTVASLSDEQSRQRSQLSNLDNQVRSGFANQAASLQDILKALGKSAGAGPSSRSGSHW